MRGKQDYLIEKIKLNPNLTKEELADSILTLRWLSTWLPKLEEEGILVSYNIGLE